MNSIRIINSIQQIPRQVTISIVTKSEKVRGQITVAETVKVLLFIDTIIPRHYCFRWKQLSPQ